MTIKTIEFVTGVTLGDDIPQDLFNHVVFIGRSNVGKSSLINLVANKKELARSSATAGHTKQINFYLANKSFYLVDLPGYGYAQGSFDARDSIQQLIEWYLTYPDLDTRQKIVLIVDAKVGLTDLDRQMVLRLEDLEKDFVVVANKIDKLKKNELTKSIEAIEVAVHPHAVIPFSVVEKQGLQILNQEISKLVDKKS